MELPQDNISSIFAATVCGVTTHSGARRSHDDADTEEICEFLNGNIIAASAEFICVSTLKALYGRPSFEMSRSFTDQMLRYIMIRPSVLDRAQPPG